jgi:hypothetical protein
MLGASCLRGIGREPMLEHKMIQSRFNYRTWSRTYNYGGSWRGQNLPFDVSEEQHIQNLLSLATVLEDNNAHVFVVVTANNFYIYSSDVALLTTIANTPGVDQVSFKESVVNRPRDSVKVTHSDYQHRSYFSERVVSEESRISIRNMLSSQEDIRIGPGLGRWLKRPAMMKNSRLCWTQRYYFFDHNNPSIGFMLGLIEPGIIRKTVAVLTK